MSHVHEHPTVPRGAKLFGGGMIAAALALTAAVQVGWLDPLAVPSVERAEAGAVVQASRELRFLMGQEDMIRVQDVRSGADIAHYAQGEGGFVRGAMRGLGRDRRMAGVPMDTPYTLTRWSDGSISLTDHGTGDIIEMGAFGPDNRAAFEALLSEETH